MLPSLAQQGGARPDCCTACIPIMCAARRAGAATFALIQAVEQGQAGTYQALLRTMRYSLKNGPQHFPAAPRLAASRRFDLNRPVCL